jgi:uncharacterized iron-regulated membrane protein
MKTRIPRCKKKKKKYQKKIQKRKNRKRRIMFDTLLVVSFWVLIFYVGFVSLACMIYSFQQSTEVNNLFAKAIAQYPKAPRFTR